MRADREPFTILTELRAAADTRAAAIVAQYPDWPCRQGCSHCCRSLARLPELSGVEWREIEAGLALLPAATRAEVEARLVSSATGSPPYTCAFLDPEAGSCLVYAHRPIACRTYGFYVDERGTGLYCGMIREKVEAGEFSKAVWGNHSALEYRLEELGPVGP